MRQVDAKPDLQLLSNAIHTSDIIELPVVLWITKIERMVDHHVEVT